MTLRTTVYARIRVDADVPHDEWTEEEYEQWESGVADAIRDEFLVLSLGTTLTNRPFKVHVECDAVSLSASEFTSRRVLTSGRR